ncbi:MAG: radical SAM protein [Candidatus Omnitrophica bacterium]|nr:radical SAM protein [Candidatus Omnitrophota bacterium]MBU1926029.1 radical SAM protein [Candidatus Omnitrophota bacterium]
MVNFTRLLGSAPEVSEAFEAVNRNLNEEFGSTTKSPLVIFNLTRRCNLKCRHCYLEAKDIDFKNELNWADIKNTINCFAKIKIPILLLSGGEPLLHKDIFKIIEYAKTKNIHVGLSTNGTLISRSLARKLRDLKIDYVGVSIDGTSRRHDEFRGVKGAFDAAMRGIINSLEMGIKTGMRFTINKLNAVDLAPIITLCVQEKIPRFCMYHLVYSGRGKLLKEQDLDNNLRRQTIDFLIECTCEINRKVQGVEILTVDNHADGIHIYNYLRKKNSQNAAQVLELLKLHGGCSAGCRVVDISPEGNVYPCQFWQDNSLGNIKEKDFLEIWTNKRDNLLCQLRSKQFCLKGKCGRCRYKAYCGGCRIRAGFMYKDFFQEDPCCYLTEAEIG